MKPLTMDEFIEVKYPPPKLGERDYKFYEGWGYEQWLIKTYKYDLEQLRILERSAYNIRRLAVACDEKGGLLELCKGRPIVRARHILEGFLMTSCPKGAAGVSLWQEGDVHFCSIATHVTVFRPLLRDFTLDEIEITEHLFESKEQVSALCEPQGVAYTHELKKEYVKLPDREGVWYIFDAHSPGCTGDWWVQAAIAPVKKRGGGHKRPPKREAERFYYRNKHDLERVEIVD